MPAPYIRTAVACAALAATVDCARAQEEAPGAHLEEILVTATRNPRRIEDEPTRVEVIDPSELDEKISTEPGDLGMVLRETSGLHVQTTAPGLGSANVRIEGLRGRYTKILADGLPLYGGQTSGSSLLQIPPLDLRQVELLKGVSSALYGASALGGVVNFVSRRPDGVQEALVNGTSRGGSDAVLWWGGPPAREGGSYSLLVSDDRQPAQDLNGDGWTDIPGYRREVIRPRFFWDGGGGREIVVTTGATIEERNGGTVAGGVVPAASPGGLPFVESMNTKRFDLGLSARWPLAQDRVLSLRGSASSLDLHQVFGQVLEPSRSSTAFAETTLSGNLGRHFWVAGGALEHDALRDGAAPANNYVYDVPGLFLQDEWSASETATISGSGRVDHHNAYGTFFSPRLAMLWRPFAAASPWSVRFSAGTGFYAPTPITEDTEATGLSRIVPAAHLQAERASGLSIDLNRLWRPGNGTVETNATIFSSTIRHAVSVVPLAATADRFTFANADAPTRNFGTELLARLHAGAFTVLGAYTYLDATELLPGSLVRSTVALNPRHSANFSATWEEEGAWHVNFECFFTGQQALIDNPYRSTSPSFVQVGLLVQRQFGSLTVFVNGENLTDRRQTRVDPLVLPSQAANGRWTTDAWAPLDGRIVSFGVRWRFGEPSQGTEKD